MKKLLIICILIVSLVFISGCTGEEKINLEADDGESSIVSQINPKSDINTEQKENSLQDLEHFIDPKLSNVRIESPDIEVVRFELIDRREFENDENYAVRILVSNDGDTPVWMNGPLLLYSRAVKSNVYSKLILLESGERKWFTISIKSQTGHEFYLLKYLGTLAIHSHRTVTPDISPELKNLNLNSIEVYQRYGSSTVRSNFPAFDINSIKYEEEGEWKYIIMGMTYRRLQGGMTVYFKLGSGPSFDTTINKKFNAEQFGQIQYIKIPVPKSSTIESVNAISLSV